MTFGRDKSVEWPSKEGDRCDCSCVFIRPKLSQQFPCAVFLGQKARDGKDTREEQWKIGYSNYCYIDIVEKRLYLDPARRIVQVLNAQRLPLVSNAGYLNEIDWTGYKRAQYASWMKMTDPTSIGMGVHFELTAPERVFELLQWLLPYWIYSERLVSEFAKKMESPDSSTDEWEQIRRGVIAPKWRLACQSIGLTLRQSEVLAWLEDGKTNKEVAVVLGCTPETIKAHVREISSRLGTSGRNEAIRRFREALYEVATVSKPHPELRL